MKLLASVLRRRALTAALLLPVVLLSLASTGFALWRCQFDGVARSACCCPKPASGEASAATADEQRATLSQPACCDLERHPRVRPPAELGRQNPVLAVVLAAAVVSTIPVGTVLPPPLPLVSRPIDPAGGPPVGRALVVEKHAFLI